MLGHRAVLFVQYYPCRVASAGVRVFEQASRGENMILRLLPQGAPDTAEVAQELLGKEIWVSWPHMVEAKVFEVWDERRMFYLGGGGGGGGGGRQHQQQAVQSEEHDEGKRTVFQLTVKSITEKYKSRWGVEIGPTKVILQAAPMTGRKVCEQPGHLFFRVINFLESSN